MTAQTAADIRAAMAIIPTPETWCQEAEGRDKHGGKVQAVSKYCISRCMIGAVRQWSFSTFPTLKRERKVDAALCRAAGVKELAPVVSWQDEPGRTHTEVLALMERAAQNEERDA